MLLSSRTCVIRRFSCTDAYRPDIISFTLTLVSLVLCRKSAEGGCVSKAQLADRNVTSRFTDVSNSGISYTGCPRKCHCKADIHRVGTSVDCSSQGLTQVPDSLPSNTTELMLAYNKISSIFNDDFRDCHWLQMLDLSLNNLMELEEDAFASLTKLQTLKLDGNRISYHSLPANIFHNQTTMRVLLLYNNSWQISTSYPQDAVFKTLTDLQRLSIDGIPNTPFSRGFSFLKRLFDLNVFGGLDVITNDTFAVFANSSVTDLKIHTGILCNTEPMSFAHFSKLTTLDVSYSTSLGLSNASISWWGLQFTNISTLKLTRVQPYTVHSKSIEAPFFNFFNLTNITALILSDNDIVDMYPIVYKSLPKLVHLDVSYNRLTYVASFILDLWHLRHLRYLDVSHQTKRHLYPPSVNNNVYKKASIQISDYVNSTTKKSNGTHFLHRHVHAEKKPNFFDNCRSPPLPQCPKIWPVKPKEYYPSDTSLCVPISPTAEYFIMNEGLNIDLPDLQAYVVFGGSKMKRFEYRSNGIKALRNYFIITQPTKHVAVDFSNNKIFCISPDVFKYSAKLGCSVSQLLLGGNDLGPQMKADTDGITFRYLNVTVLDLSRNGISELPTGVFSELHYVETLNLSENWLRLVAFHFHRMRQIKMLDLSYNLIASVDETALYNFSALMKHSNLSISFVGNPIQCSCETLNFLKWVENSRMHLIDVDQYVCVFHGQTTSFANLSSFILVDLNFRCSEPTAVIVSASMTALVLILVVVSAFCYRYRWEVRYFCLKAANRVRRYQLLEEEDYTYDAIVVYSDEDSQWVTEELVPHIEDEAHGHTLKLCVQDRDFVPGEYVIGAIWSRMQVSRKVILVISPNFVRDNYCNYQVDVGRAMGVDKGRNLFVPVMLADVEMEAMSEYLQWIIRKMTYMEWPPWLPDREEFWRKLRESISSVDVFAPI